METFAELLYLVAAVLFFLGLKKQAHVKTSRFGNQLASLAMLVAVVATLIFIPATREEPINWTLIIVGLVVGGAIGAYFARKVAMTAMPEMVALLNGSGGIASSLVALAVLFAIIGNAGDASGTLGGAPDAWASALGLILSILVGGITFSGSLVAFGKLAGKLVPDKPVLLPARHAINAALLLAMIVLGVLLGFVVDVGGVSYLLAILLLAASFTLGVLLVIGIGGADMPVVISLLNSYSGIAAAMTGFAIDNNLLLIAGALVGAAGLILTQIMCKAMNRSLANVLFGGFGAAAATGGGGEYTNVTSSSAEEAAMVIESAQSVIFVPGYGLAVSQSQHTIRELATELEKRGIDVKYAIHPVAGRMPGHMNVLLAEADVPYTQLVELDDINPEFKNTDVVVVVGANDVVNPAALHDETSPLWGMPILTAHEARSVFIIKRSLAAGFAAVRNELFDADNAYMLFGDGKKMLQEILTAIREG